MRLRQRHPSGSAEAASAPSGVPEPPLLVEPSATCRAPLVSLRFSPNGEVHACCANDTVPLGRVGERRLKDLWNGPEVQRLRDALAVGDFSLGCEGCGSQIQVGARSTTPAAMYDSFPDEVSEWPRRLEFALSNTCNLQCLHCNGELSSSIRAQREHRRPLPAAYDDRFFEEIQEFLPHLEVAVFIGGEPFLALEARRMWDLLLEGGYRPEVHVTTNGTIWNSRIERYVDELNMVVAISIDGLTAEVNDPIRLGSELAVVDQTRDRLREIARANGVPLGINHCLLLDNWHELGAFLLEAEALGDRVTVIPVFYPEEMSLFWLPEPELAPIVAAMEDEDGRIRDLLDLNRPAWTAGLHHLRMHLDHIREGGLPVSIRQRKVVTDRPAGAIDASIEALGDWSELTPLVLSVDRGRISLAAPEPEWSHVLGASGWVGTHVEDLMAAIAELGDVRVVSVDAVAEPVDSTFELRVGRRELTVRSHYHRPDGADHGVVVIAAVDSIRPNTADDQKEAAAP